MASQTLKRQADENVKVQDNLNDEEFDVTWGGKKCRYLYNYTLQSVDSTSNSDSDLTESILSIQSKSTMRAETLEELEFLSESGCCKSECSCSNSCSSIFTEFDVMSSSSSNHKINYSNSTDSSTSFEHKFPENIIVHNESSLDSDNGYIPDDKDKDVKVTSPKKKLPTPACFKFCLQCNKENSNPYYQYCYKCYRYRKEFFVKKPSPKPKSIKCLNEVSNCKKVKKCVKSNISLDSSCSEKSEISLGRVDSQESGVSIETLQSQESGISLGMSNSQESNSEKSNIEPDEMNMIEDKTESFCNVCFINPKNSIFNHGKTGHIFCCYKCAKKIFSQSGKCPICNFKIKYVTKLIVV